MDTTLALDLNSLGAAREGVDGGLRPAGDGKRSVVPDFDALPPPAGDGTLVGMAATGDGSPVLAGHSHASPGREVAHAPGGRSDPRHTAGGEGGAGA